MIDKIGFTPLKITMIQNVKLSNFPLRIIFFVPSLDTYKELKMLPQLNQDFYTLQNLLLQNFENNYT